MVATPFRAQPLPLETMPTMMSTPPCPAEEGIGGRSEGGVGDGGD